MCLVAQLSHCIMHWPEVSVEVGPELWWPDMKQGPLSWPMAMLDSGKIGVCCGTVGPGTTNLITGVASAYDNHTPLLVITAQTSLANFGKGATHESADTGINAAAMFSHCTHYFSLLNFGVLTNVSDTPFVFLPEKHRDNKYSFVQDVWSLANDWELTAGIRYDAYNDFGDTWNPRLALVWSARHDTTLKLLYVQAFRAPSFAEFRNQNNPVALGNDELDLEEIETFEFALDYRPAESLHLGANVFYYKWDDIIRFVQVGSTLTAQNADEQTGYGFELEMEWIPTGNFSLLTNYAFQDSEDEDSNKDAGNAPHHQIYARANWEFMPNWIITPAVNFVLDRDRPPRDSRDELDDYAVVDLTLRSKAFSNS